MSEDTEDNEVINLTSEDLTREEKIEKLEELCDEIGLDVEELAGGPVEDLDFEGVLTIHVEDEDGEVKHHQEVEF